MAPAHERLAGTTAVLALVVGGLSGSAVLSMATLIGAVGVHLYLRRTR
jgi:hypothetical protein